LVEVVWDTSILLDNADAYWPRHWHSGSLRASAQTAML
jgi:hypothetical protein